MSDDVKKLPQSPWAWLGAVALAAVAGWTGIAEGAWCSLSLKCVAYIPAALFGGVLFAPIAVIAAVILTVVVFVGFRARPGLLTWLVIVVVNATMGLAVGSMPGVHGQGP